MSYTAISSEIIFRLKEIVGDRFVLLDNESLERCSHDETEDLNFFPEDKIVET